MTWKSGWTRVSGSGGGRPRPIGGVTNRKSQSQQREMVRAEPEKESHANCPRPRFVSHWAARSRRSLQPAHIEVAFAAPERADDMPETGGHQDQGAVAVRKGPDNSGAAANLAA